MTTTNDPTCSMCGVTAENHTGRRHPFTPAGMPMDQSFLKKQDAQVPPVQQMPAPAAPFDPVLRMALINKGLITPEDLTAAEKLVFTVSSGLWGGASGDNARPQSGQ